MTEHIGYLQTVTVTARIEVATRDMIPDYGYLQDKAHEAISEGKSQSLDIEITERPERVDMRDYI